MAIDYPPSMVPGSRAAIWLMRPAPAARIQAYIKHRREGAIGEHRGGRAACRLFECGAVERDWRASPTITSVSNLSAANAIADSHSQQQQNYPWQGMADGYWSQRLRLLFSGACCDPCANSGANRS